MKKIVKKRQLFNNKLVLNILLVLFMFLTIGYSTLSTNLNINGNLNVKKYYEPTLYNVLAKEADTGGLAHKYTGEHHDSFTEEPSKDIYHWYAVNDTQGTQVLEKNNVIFAGQCFQMIRTTDTGGVKMIYNGEVENNQCLSTRDTHRGFSYENTNLSSNYWYGTDYTYDSTNKLFTISGTTQQVKWSDSTYHDLIGKYTCKSSSVGAACSNLYYVDSYNSPSYANVYVHSGNILYSQIGSSQFNSSRSSPTYVGYKYGYNKGSFNTFQISGKRTSVDSYVLSSRVLSLSVSDYYADSVIYDSVTNEYVLDSPYTVSTSSDLKNLVGKYTFRSSNSSYTNVFVYYIAGVDSSNRMSFIELRNNDSISNYETLLGDSITDNGDNTYTLNNTFSVTVTDWYSNYSNYVNIYTCGDNTNTCENPRFITETSNRNYYYLTVKNVLISKGRNGLELTDTLLARSDEMAKNPSDYTSYKYTCNNTNNVCSEQELSRIKNFTSSGYYYDSNRYYGSSVTWDGTNYTLVDPIGVERSSGSGNNLSNHHFTCLGVGEKTCSTVGFIYMSYLTNTTSNLYCVFLSNGVLTIDEILEGFLESNLYDSIIKTNVDYWYRENILDYDNYLEDIIYCNGRNISARAGWDPTAAVPHSAQGSDYLTFSNASQDLSCPKVTDRFSISNVNAQSLYKVGLMTLGEAKLLGNNNITSTGTDYWLMTAAYYNKDSIAKNFYITNSGGYRSSSVISSYGVRPVITLKPGIEYTDGDGSMANPYVVDTSGN